MTAPLTRILVVGGGIAGLAAARALRGVAQVVIVERSADGRPEGTGIYLPGNGGAALERLGITERSQVCPYASASSSGPMAPPW